MSRAWGRLLCALGWHEMGEWWAFWHEDDVWDACCCKRKGCNISKIQQRNGPR